MVIRRLVIDVLKPHEPPVVELTTDIAEVGGVEGVNASLMEIDEEVENLKLTVEGEIEFDEIKSEIEDKGASVHSVDEVAAGEKLVEKVETPQD